MTDSLERTKQLLQKTIADLDAIGDDIPPLWIKAQLHILSACLADPKALLEFNKITREFAQKAHARLCHEIADETAKQN